MQQRGTSLKLLAPTQQWRDILGILKLQQSALDFTYLQQWGHPLQLTAQLQQALGDSLLRD